MSSTFRMIIQPAWRALPVTLRSRLLRLGRLRVHRQPVPGADGSEVDKFYVGTPSLSGFLESIRKNGFSPSAILDVGANVGEWSRTASSVFTSSRILMFDGDPDNEPALQNAVREIGGRAKMFLALLGPEKKDAVTLFRPDTGTTGSSILRELTSFKKEEVVLSMNTLDSLLDSAALQAPLLLKLDVQGFELEVLKGATRTLQLSEVLILETSLLPYNEGAPLFAEVIAFMEAEGFLAFDFCGQLRRQSDHALFQTDVAFVRHDSPLRAPRKFWLREP